MTPPDVQHLDVDPGTVLSTVADSAWVVDRAVGPETAHDAYLYAFGSYVDGDLIDPRGAPDVTREVVR